jgi:DNA repair protein RadC
MSTEKKSIKEWALDDRPREKMLGKGKAAMSDTELIAILIGSGNSEQTAVGLASSILESVGNNLIALSDLTIEDWMRHKGIGPAKAVTVMAGLELGRRLLGSEAAKPDKLTNSRDAYKRMLPYIDDFSQEHFLVMYLDMAKTILKIECVSTGGSTHTIADPRVVFKKALNLGATLIIIAHNHPSGSLKPSADDVRLTKKFVAAGDLLDIKVIDHLILCRGDYYSFFEKGELNP